MTAVRKYENLLLLAVGAVCLAISAIRPYDWLTWWLEVLPAILGAGILIAIHRRFPFTQLVYHLVLIHALILILGAHYSYARVPFGFRLQDVFDLSRNPYDRIGHFAQGFFPAIIVREVLLRSTPLRRGRWLFFLVVSVCLAFSAFYEFIEWWAALAGGESAEAFLGTQRDVWDTQSDMFMALLGAISAQLLLAGIHDRALRKMETNHQPPV